MFNFSFSLSRLRSLPCYNSPSCLIFPCHFLPTPSPPPVFLCSCRINRPSQSVVLFAQYALCEIKWKQHCTLFDKHLLLSASAAVWIGQALSPSSPIILSKERDGDRAVVGKFLICGRRSVAEDCPPMRQIISENTWRNKKLKCIPTILKTVLAFRNAFPTQQVSTVFSPYLFSVTIFNHDVVIACFPDTLLP